MDKTVITNQNSSEKQSSNSIKDGTIILRTNNMNNKKQHEHTNKTYLPNKTN